MNWPGGISRRRFLLGAGAATPLALVPLKPWRALIQIAIPRDPVERLTGLLANRDSARIVGRAYLSSSADETTAAALVDAIASGLPDGLETIERSTTSELRGLMASKVRQDFDRDRTINLRSWIVSRTEARLCALAAVEGRAASRST